MRPLLAALLILLAGCGWQLRGELMPPLDINHLRIEASEEHTELQRELEQALARQGIAVVEPPAEAGHTLILGDESLTKRTVGVGSDSLAAAFELTLELDYQLYDSAGTLLAPASTAQVIRSFDASDPTGLEREQDLLEREMRRELVQQLMRRLYFSLRDAPGANTGREP
ncbi:LPS-assembly lipoprotein LptE [Gilvimarinus algae]|uniref:LPS-assembly lipoprotein LptE n=1 Tax=Gilvimarinus algae TaxID=3058037 RepID=A0ABT8TDC7_9GAMM|nr:LPS assembly lipoprotein LptE [Gilvimarinus sp. SDUM040014]MDO3381930.1 LPS assembly lipoprotein LptE [Gilvimarinus sp. SDUM040014]